MIRPKLWASARAAAPAALLGTMAVHAWPHARGIGFDPWVRLAALVPACFVLAVAATFLARRGFAVLLGAAALGVVVWGHPELLVVPVFLAWRVPRVLSLASSRVGTVAIALLAALEIAGVGLGLASERPALRAADVSRAELDVEHRFLTLPSGARVHYVDEGVGHTLLFLHGNPAWSFQWRTLIAGLRRTHRCVALDYPGFGRSEAPAGFGFTPREQSQVVEDLVTALDLHDVTLVMQDWGGPIGIGFAERHPDRVRGFVLGSTWAWPTTTSEPRGKFSLLMGGPLGEVLQMNFDAFAAFGIDNGVVRTLRPAELDGYLAPFRPLAGRGVAAFYPGQINAATDYFTTIEAGLSRLSDKPALVFWALQDQGFPAADRERWERVFPRHETIELPDANHFFFEDAAPTMVEKMRALP